MGGSSRLGTKPPPSPAGGNPRNNRAGQDDNKKEVSRSQLGRRVGRVLTQFTDFTTERGIGGLRKEQSVGSCLVVGCPADPPVIARGCPESTPMATPLSLWGEEGLREDRAEGQRIPRHAPLSPTLLRTHGSQKP